MSEDQNIPKENPQSYTTAGKKQIANPAEEAANENISQEKKIEHAETTNQTSDISKSEKA
jgi:hypothetical protein